MHDSRVDPDTTARPTGSSGTAPELAQLAVIVERVSDRLRSLSDTRLARPRADGRSRADAAHAVAQLLADLAAELEARPARPVPRLHDLAVGDQVAVTGHDLVQAFGSARIAGPHAPVMASALAAVRALQAQL